MYLSLFEPNLRDEKPKQESRAKFWLTDDGGKNYRALATLMVGKCEGEVT